MTKVVKLSSGHSKYVSGANGIVQEVATARELTNLLASYLKADVTVSVLHDNVSKTQKSNLTYLNNWHDGSHADLHVSVHLNSSGLPTKEDKGIEVLYRYPEDKPFADKLAYNISKATGLKNRGGKQRSNLAFLNKPGKFILEAYFVNSYGDVEKMNEEKEKIDFALAFRNTVLEYLKVDKKVPHRVKTGEITGLVKAKNILDKIKLIKGYPVKSVNIVANGDDKWYIQSGVFNSKEEAQKFANYLTNFKIVSKVHVIKA